jgi:dihydrofolate reductase
MGLLTFTLNVTLDGCYDHREMIADDELHDYFTQLLGAGGGILYGRTTFELMEAYWPAGVGARAGGHAEARRVGVAPGLPVAQLRQEGRS